MVADGTSSFEMLASRMLRALPPGGTSLVAIDGADGSGKTTFAARLVREVRMRPAIVVHLDDFLNPPQVRHARGRHSPEGFWFDTYDYDAFATHVEELRAKSSDLVAIVEGMFLHRERLRGLWHYSFFLDVPFTETAARMASRDGSNPDPEHTSMRRYVGGQQLYFAADRPWRHASVVVDNSASLPRVIEPEQTFAARSRQVV